MLLLLTGLQLTLGAFSPPYNAMHSAMETLQLLYVTVCSVCLQLLVLFCRSAETTMFLYLLALQPLKPKEGRFLPAAAALGGLLFLAPEGHLPAQHDVLRLQHDGPSLPILRQQQGYISCEPKPDVSTAWSVRTARRLVHLCCYVLSFSVLRSMSASSEDGIINVLFLICALSLGLDHSPCFLAGLLLSTGYPEGCPSPGSNSPSGASE